MMEKLLTQKKVQEYLGVSSSTLEQWRLKGVGPCWVKVGGRLVRYRYSDLLQYISSLQAFQSTTEADEWKNNIIKKNGGLL